MDPPALRLDDSLPSLVSAQASFPAASAHGTMVYISAVTLSLLLAAVQNSPCLGSLAQTSTDKYPVAIRAVSRPSPHVLEKLDAVTKAHASIDLPDESVISSAFMIPEAEVDNIDMVCHLQVHVYHAQSPEHASDDCVDVDPTCFFQIPLLLLPAQACMLCHAANVAASVPSPKVHLLLA